MKTTQTPIELACIRLVRLGRGASYLRFEPPVRCKCGGELQVRDYRSAQSRSYSSRDMRYEAFCTNCNTCDPNGYGSQSAVIEHAPNYVKPNVSDQATASARL